MEQGLRIRKTEVLIYVTEAAAKNLRHSAVNAGAGEILDTAQRLGVSLEPLHPTASDPEAMREFVVLVSNPERATTVCEAFSRCGAVAGAYPNAPGEPPGGYIE